MAIECVSNDLHECPNGDMETEKFLVVKAHYRSLLQITSRYVKVYLKLGLFQLTNSYIV